MEKDDEFLTVAELADYLRVHYSTILKKIEKNELPAYKFGRLYRLSRSEIEEWFRSTNANIEEESV